MFSIWSASGFDLLIFMFFYHQCFLIKANFFFFIKAVSITESAANKMNFSSMQRSWAFCCRTRLLELYFLLVTLCSNNRVDPFLHTNHVYVLYFISKDLIFSRGARRPLFLESLTPNVWSQHNFYLYFFCHIYTFTVIVLQSPLLEIFLPNLIKFQFLLAKERKQIGKVWNSALTVHVLCENERICTCKWWEITSRFPAVWGEVSQEQWWSASV